MSIQDRAQEHITQLDKEVRPHRPAPVPISPPPAVAPARLRDARDVFAPIRPSRVPLHPP
jgi:hypothetical protein